MRQFYEMKARYPDTVLFFQMGDFYETFGEDAEVVARELDITLTSRGRDRFGETMPLAGVPVHAADAYITRMIQKGYRVAVCDQVEDPKKAKGVVKRDVVRIITPGTVIDPGMLGSEGPSYLLGIGADPRTRRWGLAFLDITTGEFIVTEADAASGNAELFSEIARFSPKEAVIPPHFSEEVISGLERRGILVSKTDREIFEEDEARMLLSTHLHVSSLAGYGCEEMPAAIIAAAACLDYAKKTQKSDLLQINRISTRQHSDRMVLDAITMRNLEVTRSIRTGDENSVLLAVLDRTQTAMGSRLLRSYLASPLVDKTAIDRRLDGVEFFVGHPMVRMALRTDLYRFADIERIAGRIAYGNAGPRDLVTLKQALERVPRIIQTIKGSSSPTPDLIRGTLDSLHELPEIVSLVAEAILDDPPATLKSGGVIREGFDQRLDDLRATARGGKNWIAAFQQQEREKTGIKSLKVGYTKVFGYFIEVTKANLASVPPYYQRKQTTAGGERYVTPELQEKEALISTAEERLLALESELFAELIIRLGKDITSIQETARAIGCLDVMADLADVAERNGYTRPLIEDSRRLIIRDGRHPVVEEHLDGAFVPNDTEIDARTDQVLIITGANMAGKSTYMRAVALLCIMAQAGSFVPATHATVGIVDRIFTRVGAFDDLASGQSTFMVEMLELANILNNVTDRSLVILDEIGRGTSTLDGFAIARAVLEYLHGKGQAGPRTLFATHFHELVCVENDLKRVKNYHFAVRDTGRDVVFLRKLIPGATDRSYGIHVAALAGIPRPVIKRSEELLKEAMRGAIGGSSGRSPRYTQMLLIDAGNEENQTRHPALMRLKELDLDTMTPLDALTALHEIQRSLKGGNNGR